MSKKGKKINIKEKSLEILSKKGKLTTKDVVSSCNISRQYANSVIRKLIKEGEIVKIGSTHSAFYVFPKTAKFFNVRIKKILQNKLLNEDEVFRSIEKQLFQTFQPSKNIKDIFEYAFTEMLNNAISHSKSETIEVEVGRSRENISFTIDDFGIGVFKSIMGKRNLRSEIEAIQDLLKGKTTTQPKNHTGEGIFFTSKISDMFILDSFGYRLMIDNTIEDIFVGKTRSFKRGTKAFFLIKRKSKKKLQNLFKDYGIPPEIGFDKTKIKVKLFIIGTSYVSRSQAKRILSGLDKFKFIIFDFDKVAIIGQAFTDEIFRVFTKRHPEIKIQVINVNEAVQFMINRARKNNAPTK